MTTVKQFKDGAKLRQPIYVNLPYVVLGNNGHGGEMVLGSGDIPKILKMCDTTYYDHCRVDIREYDLHLNDNTRVDGWTLFYEKKD